MKKIIIIILLPIINLTCLGQIKILQWSRNITTSYDFVKDATANVKKILTIKTDGEKVTVKLKKTL